MERRPEMNRHICLHGHFYQPPRENPWLEEIEQQDSAYPAHDWNERISRECYEPNRAARILDDEERITHIINNYARMSFNVGPTLLSWMERHQPQTYAGILAADSESQRRFNGHGAAIAQGYGHLILPLASPQDRETQVIWGIHDFQHRFGRAPEGMWLPETAVDLATLDTLADAGIRFTLLAPHQARRIRPIGRERWSEVNDASLDTRRPYLCRLPSGKSITLFFYDGGIAQEVAFGGLLNSGEDFVRRLIGNFSDSHRPELVHIATDGETYGHHHRYGEMALAYAFATIEARELARLSIYGDFIDRFPAEYEVEIVENSSWSCAHGIERWRSDCGCRIGGEKRQSWRTPLREAMNWLSERLANLYSKEMGALGADPRSARNAYISVVLDRSETQVRSFLAQQCGRELTSEESIKALRLLEMQRQAMQMFTSCGWFFDAVTGLESTQILTYAARALQFAEQLGTNGLEEGFRRELAAIETDETTLPSGEDLYTERILPQRLDLDRVAAHRAMVSPFEGADIRAHLSCYHVEEQQLEQHQSAGMQLFCGQSRIRCSLTGASDAFDYVVLHFGAQNLSAGVQPQTSNADFLRLRQKLVATFNGSDLTGVVRLIDQTFGEQTYSLWHLFRDQQRLILNRLMHDTLEEIESNFAHLYADHATLIRFLRRIKMPLPATLGAPMEIAFNTQLRQAINTPSFDADKMQRLLEESAQVDVRLDEVSLTQASEKRLNDCMKELASKPSDLSLLQSIVPLVESLTALPWPVDLWQAQNHLLTLLRAPPSLTPEEKGPWRLATSALGQALRVRVD
ncbi:MAG: glycoside hydrolase [Desulfuromonas sp.]|nr:MAG: glycoside hydrolase [Desulfuromonas sp.]